MDSHLDISLNEMTRSYVETFLVSLREGNPALTSFLGTLSTFHATIRNHRKNLRAETLIAVNNFANLISTLISDVLDLETTTEQITSTSASDISKLLSIKMSHLSLSDSKPSKGPAYIKPSYQWLLDNLHNPYPSKELKKEIAQQTRCSVKDIDAWFIDARKRIGWNHLRKSRFANKQERIITAATHVFRPKPTSLSDEPNATFASQMDPNDLYRAEFLAMAKRARSLYADKFPELVTPIVSADAPLHTPSVKHSEEVDWKASERPFSSRKSRGNTYFVSSYPTPEPSSPVELEENPSSSTLPSANEGQPKSLKRGHSVADLTEDDFDTNHPSKRSRTWVSQISDISAIASLPSPSQTITSVDDPSDINDDGSVSEDISTLVKPTFEGYMHTIETNLSTQQISTTETSTPSEQSILKCKKLLSDGESQNQESFCFQKLSLKRKRRLSDGDTSSPPKRPLHALAHPRLQTVSDPFPIAKSWPEGTSSRYNDIPNQGLVENGDPLPLIMQGPLSLDMPQDSSDAHFGIPITFLEPFSEDLSSCFVSEAAAPIYPAETSVIFSDLYTPSYLDMTQSSSSSNVIVTTANFLDFNALHSTPDCDITNYDTFTSLSEDFSQWFTSLQPDKLPITLDSSPAILSNTDFDGLTQINSLDAKRARLQSLKAQVSQLEGQLAGEITAP